jgi:uncharacterized protein
MTVDECPIALRFELDAESGRLRARFDPAAGGARRRLDRAALLAALAEAGWSQLYLDEAAVGQLLAQSARAEAPVELEIAERRHGEFRLKIADDSMSVSLDLDRAYGGEPVSRAQIDAALAEAGVVSGILDERIEQALTKDSARDLVIARGRAAVAGQPARFESLVPQMQQRAPSVNERGIADYRELGTLVIVHAGDQLMRRTPAVPGVAGEDVFGLIVPAPIADDPPFAAGISGAAPAAEDPDLLIAEIAGQPVELKHGVSVQPTITVPAVDLSSGNIDFDGTVNVKGDVAPGMHVHATGDVFVTGAVEAAQIEAGGNITVAAGAIGRLHSHGAQAAHATQDPAGDLKVRLIAQGVVSVLFCENAVIEAGAEVQIGEVALHCELTAHTQIIIGKPGGRRSQLIGGIARAASMLQVGTLGSGAGVRTQVEIGYEPFAYAQLAALRAEIDASQARLESLQQVLAYTETLDDDHHRELRERAQRSLEVTERTHVELLDRLAEAEASLVLSENPRVVVGKAVHPGVEIRLGSKSIRTQDDGGPGMYQLEDDEIVFGGK